ncbi:TPA: tyrosine-type recombinase/integrase [Vibrio parahaemolyticus]
MKIFLRIPPEEKETINLFMKYKRYHDAIKKYEDYRRYKGINSELVDEDINRIDNLFRLLDKNPFKLSSDDALLLYKRLYLMPKYMKQKKELSGLVGKELIDKSNALRLEVISISTAEKYWNSLNSFFDWAVSLGLVENNCFSRLTPKKEKTKSFEQRKAFTETQIEQLLKSSRKYSDDLHWILIIAVELGMRQNEIAQLHRDDIVNINGVLCIYVNEGKPFQSVKNIYSNRYLPITKSLLKLGFIDFVNSKDEMLFESLTYCKKNKFSRKVSEQYSELSRSLFSDKKLTFHSIRHSFTDSLKKKNLPEDLVAELKGHQYCRETYGRYGKERSIKYKRKVLNKNSLSVVRRYAMRVYIRNKISTIIGIFR